MGYVGLNGSTMMERNILINLERNLGMSTRIHSVYFHIDGVLGTQVPCIPIHLECLVLSPKAEDI